MVAKHVVSAVALGAIAASGAALLLVCTSSALPRPGPRPKPPTRQEWAAWTSNGFAGSPWEKQALVDEYDLMAANPGMARRDGKTLTVFYRGKPLKTFIPVAPDSKDVDFDSVILGKVVKLRDAVTGRNEAVALVVEHAGEFDRSLLVLPDGKLMPVGSASASPDGLWLATGSEMIWMDEDLSRDMGRLQVRPWPGLSPAVEFPAHCRAIGWAANDSFNATCLYRIKPGGDYVYFHTRVRRDASGAWKMESIPQTKADPHEVTVGNLTRPEPPGSLPDPHLHFTGKIKAQ